MTPTIGGSPFWHPPYAGYILFAQEQPIALLGFGAAAWQTAPRDCYIGWSHEQRKRNLPLITNKACFLILPWAQSKNLASMRLAKAVRVLRGHWQETYGYRPLLLESSQLGPAGKQSVPIKDLWVYPLDRCLRDVLTG